jgi:Tol biopolymer transport system component/tRNA A-37 threonylcarbamoyl transferase component Bud32
LSAVAWSARIALEYCLARGRLGIPHISEPLTTELPVQLQSALADRYKLERELGQGGMATVYLAEDVRHRRKVAVKVLRPELAASMGPDRFLREIEIAAQLQHPHILPLLDSGDAGGFLFYVMPFVQGETLRDRLARERELPVHDALRIVTEVADALAHAHQHGVVHRDIKPENILLSGRHALVADFGVAKAVSEASGRLKLTSVGVALGTPTYMAPEQASADPNLDHRVDIYALGVVAYELLAGRAPFTGHTAQEVLAAHLTRPPEPIRNFRSNVSPAVETIVMRCLEKHPADRWQTTSELVNQLEPLATPSGGMTPTSTQPLTGIRPSIAPSKGIPRWLGWAAGGALVAGGALALTLVRRPEQTLAVGKRIAIAVGPEAERWPSLSPDGKTIVFTRRDRGTNHLYVQQVDGGAPLAIPTQLPGWQCCGALSPDGSRLLFLTPHGLYVIPTLGGQARPAGAGTSPSLSTNRFTVLWGAWSPDGQRIVYSRGDTIYVENVDESARTVVAHGKALHSPAWSSDGRWIALVQGNPQFEVNGNSAPSVVEVVSASGGTPIRVTDSTALNTSPVWVPGRSALLFISDKDGGRDVYELGLSSSGKPNGSPTRITAGLNPDRIAVSGDGKRLAWSVYSENSNVWTLPIPSRDSVPLSQATTVTSGSQDIETAESSRDGKWLYYESDLKGNADIWRVPLAEGAAVGSPEQVTSDPGAEFSPSVSPDGKEVAFHSFRTGNRDIFVAPSSGGPAVQVTTSREHDWNPSWSPDGRALVFDEQLNPDSSLWMVRRGPNGSWDTPRALPFHGVAAIPAWSPDGRSISFSGDSGIRIMEIETGRQHLVAPASGGNWTAWSGDGRTLYLADNDSLQGFMIRAIPAAGGPARTLVYGSSPDQQLHRYGLSASNGRFYFPLVERKADVWVAETERK